MKKHVPAMILSGFFLTFIMLTLGYGYYWNAVEKSPSQPIKFSHQLHLTSVGLECDFCHEHADEGLWPSMPALELCMACHKDVKTDSPEIKILAGYWERKAPVPWLRVYELPEFVFFTHKRHIKAGIKCEQCHGELAGMDSAQRVRSLEMGWCLRCHRLNSAPDDCSACHK